MKKFILAAAVATALAPVGAAMADTKVYGALRMSALSEEKGGEDVNGLVNNASRLGIKGAYGEEGKTQGFFNIQVGLQTDAGGADVHGVTTRFAMAGLKGSWGKVIAGRLSSPYKMAGLRMDPFYDTSAGPLNGGSNYGLSTLTNGWFNNSLGYVSPKLGDAVTISAVAFLDKNDNSPNQPNNKNFYNIGADLDLNGFIAGLHYLSEIGGGATRGTLGWKNDTFYIGGSYESFSDQGSMGYLAGTWKINNTKLAASYGNVSDFGFAGPRNTDGKGWTIGAFQKVASKTEVTLMYSTTDYDATEEGAPNDGDRDVFALGLIQKF